MAAKSTLERNRPSPRYMRRSAVDSATRGGIEAVSRGGNATEVSRVNGQLFAGLDRFHPVRVAADDLGAHGAVIDAQPDGRGALGLGVDHAIGHLALD